MHMKELREVKYPKDWLDRGLIEHLNRADKIRQETRKQEGVGWLTGKGIEARVTFEVSNGRVMDI